MKIFRIVLLLLILACDALAATSITVTDYPNYRIFQREGDHNRDITVSGTYTGTAPGHVEARVLKYGTSTVIKDWTDLVNSTISGGNFSGTLPDVPEGNENGTPIWYTLQVRCGDQVGIYSNGSHYWGIGLLYLCVGQSNMHLACYNPPGGTDVPNSTVSMYDGVWGPAQGNLAVNFVNTINDAEHVPVGILMGAWVGSALRCGGALGNNYGCWLDTAAGKLYQKSIDMVSTVGGIEAILWYQGESDAVDFGSYDYYLADLGTLYSRYQSSIRSDIPFLMAQLATCTSLWVSSDAAWDSIKRAQFDFATAISGAMLACTNTDAAMQNYNNDGTYVHLSTSDWRTAGLRFAQAELYRLGHATYYRGPSILGFKRIDATHLDVYIQHRGGTDFTPTSDITGFTVLNDGSAVTVSSAARSAANTIRLTTASTTWGTTITVRYQYGHSPDISGAVHDNSSLALPLEMISTTTEMDEPVADTTPPSTSGWNPSKSATGVSRSANIVLHVTDSGDGVDQSSIVMTVEGVTVTPTITGTSADYTLTYNPPIDFSYGQVVNVTVDASDLASTPNVMTQDSYSFTVESAPSLVTRKIGGNPPR